MVGTIPHQPCCESAASSSDYLHDIRSISSTGIWYSPHLRLTIGRCIGTESWSIKNPNSNPFTHKASKSYWARLDYSGLRFSPPRIYQKIKHDCLDEMLGRNRQQTEVPDASNSCTLRQLLDD